MTSLEDNIITLLSRESGLKGRDIAQRLQIDKSIVNSVLYQLRSKQLIRQDKAYRWYPGSKVEPSTSDSPQTVNSTLAKLCNYYLQCLSLDDESGVSLFAQSKFSPEYIELPFFPDFDPEKRPITVHPGVSDLFRRIRGGAKRQVPLLGYPVRIRHHRNDKGWSGYFVEPVLLFEFNDEAAQSSEGLSLAGDLPVLNFSVLRSLCFGDGLNVMDEAARLAEELGFSETDPPETDELIGRLVEVRSEWDWKEKIDPSSQSSGTLLSEISEPGIYNRAIFFGHERSAFTKGLEHELSKLQAIPEDKYRSTALGAWLARDFKNFSSTSAGAEHLLEPLPLNVEQREAIQKALTKPLTVITGPPGTGKSQVVSSLLINAAKLGRKVLFVSKNNKAVDVVEARVNSLGPRPVLLRLGRGSYQANLANYLTTLLASRVSEEDVANFKEAEEKFVELLAKVSNIQEISQRIILARNSVDAAERKVEFVRKEIGPNKFVHLKKLDEREIAKSADLLREASINATRNLQPFFTLLLWPLVRPSRVQNLKQAAQQAEAHLNAASLPIPAVTFGDSEVAAWNEAANQLLQFAKSVAAVGDYFEKLRTLTEGPRLEDNVQKLSKLTEELADNSMRIWETWLRLAPSRMSQQQRQALGEFNAVLRLIASSDEQKQFAGKEVFARYYRLFPELVNLLPCWAVTSLSARGRIPLEAGFFDILVVDEASQCDIASLLPLLYRARTAVIIGDPMQLRHISSISARRDRDLLQQHGLAQAHANWAFSENSVFDLACPLTGADEIIMLRDHHRSHADIIGFSNEHFYDGRLRVATNYDKLNCVPGDNVALRWINVDGQISRLDSSSVNDAEALVVVQEIERMVISQGYRGSIGVVTPFRAQANRIRDLLHKHPKANFLIEHGEILIDTVHRFQGDERDVMLFSPVVAPGMSESSLGFLRKSGNLFNVAITRARSCLIVVGSKLAARSSEIKHLSAFTNYVEGFSKKSSHTTDFNEVVTENGSIYPVVSRPELVSDWERIFYHELYKAGLRPIPQFDVEKFTLDFALIADNRRLDIEVDGERYHRDWNGELLRRDQMRNMRLIELGWDVMRFWVYEIRDMMPECVARVKSWFEDKI